MKIALFISLCLILFIFPVAGKGYAQTGASNHIVVIVNAASPVTTLTRKELSDLYLGRTRALGAMKVTIAIDQATNSPIRAQFYQDLTGKNIAEINSYWARLLFAGQSSPPQTMPDSNTVLDLVRKNSTSVGYLNFKPDDKSIRVVLTLGE